MFRVWVNGSYLAGNGIKTANLTKLQVAEGINAFCF
jgi:hypothetical protein